DEPVEPGLAGKLGVERGRDDVALADGDDPVVVETGEDVDVRAGPGDDRGPDEHAVNRLVAENRHGQVGLERVELTAERVSLDGDVEERQDRLLATRNVAGQDDHAGAGAEQRYSADGQIEDRRPEAPAIDELAHRRRLAARD